MAPLKVWRSCVFVVVCADDITFLCSKSMLLVVAVALIGVDFCVADAWIGSRHISGDVPGP